MTLAAVFANSNQTITTGNSTLAGTQQLTNTAATIVELIMDAFNKPVDEETAAKFTERVAKSTSDAEVLDSLIAEHYDLSTIDIDFLKALDDETLESMLKSQQSKRSRCKAKEMTMDNYKSMMNAAIAETLLRLAMGKTKGSFGARSTSLVYSDDRLAQLANDQEALRKEIRNVQSKKSILKSKAGFTESDDRWQALLVAEAQLKGIRVDGVVATKVVVEADPLRDNLKEMLAELDESTMSAKQLKELVALIKGKAFDDVTEEEVTANE